MTPKKAQAGTRKPGVNLQGPPAKRWHTPDAGQTPKRGQRQRSRCARGSPKRGGNPMDPSWTTPPAPTPRDGNTTFAGPHTPSYYGYQPG